MDVIETDTANVQVNSEGATSYVNNYKIMDMLGEGTFSKVYLCQNDTGTEFALKIINKSILKRKREYKRVDGKLVLSNAFQKVQKEVAIMKKLAHSNLVRLYEVIDSPADDKLFLVLELIRGGQVMHWDDQKFRYYARNTTTGVLGKETVRECMRDVVAALDFLHSNHICHRDIKPENILLSGDQYKLADFGVAHMNEDEPSISINNGNVSSLKLRSTEGTYHFLAPECTTGDEYDPYQVDVWAMGVTMFTLLSGTLPFGTGVASLSDVMTSIREDTLALPPNLDTECSELLAQLLEKNPHKRITVSQLKTHPWLSGADDELIRRPSSTEVIVTQQEIEAAFTPVNNFILVMKLKMKMSSRLNNARKALANISGARLDNAIPVTQHVPVTSSQPPEEKAKGGKESKASEMALGELPRVKIDKLQRRPSRLVESISETVGSFSTSIRQLGGIVPIFEGAASSTSSLSPEKNSPDKTDAIGCPGPVLRRISARNLRNIEASIFDMPLRPDSEPLTGITPAEEICGDLSPSINEARRTSLVSLNRDNSPTKPDIGNPPNAHKLTKRKSISLAGMYWDEK
ncbi:serine/threonine protein kinase [Phytophthora nicotianae]|uniref:Serine/threonine protein kinase n=1 Tax=Phytophthora nicotianae TaxID=4792 RepID=W2H9M0_PHYNI|nr:serine/threonine protein kinase [Phytophthora nicotianae]